MTESVSKRIDDIEMLRGFAVLFVVLQHANVNLLTWTTPALSRFYTYFAGWFGVDLFFAISGFVIARDLIPRLRACIGTKSIFNVIFAFWVRRAWRLLPSAWLWLSIILIVVLAFNQSGAFGSFKANIGATIAGILQFANFRLAESFGQWEYGASAVYWSLSLEEQFYLLFPFIIIGCRRFLPFVLISLIFLQLISPRVNMLWVVLRTDAMAMGVLIALWTQSV